MKAGGTAPHIQAMKVLMIAIGTRGDVQPFVTPGVRLVRDGHAVHLAAADSFADGALGARMRQEPGVEAVARAPRVSLFT